MKRNLKFCAILIALALLTCGCRHLESIDKDLLIFHTVPAMSGWTP